MGGSEVVEGRNGREVVQAGSRPDRKHISQLGKLYKEFVSIVGIHTSLKMGKKDKGGKKKGKGAEKTLEKTEKKIKLKLKKNTGEEDVESIVKAIEEEEKKRSEVKEVKLKGSPSHRSNLSIVPHPEAPEIVLFGGEFYNGQKTLMNNDLVFYDIKRREWKEVRSPGGPPPRCSHQAVVSAQSGGQMWVFGGEYASPSETQFHHYRDLWVYHFASKRWEKIPVPPKEAPQPPSSRSGHRMVMVKRHLVIFGGFHDSFSGDKTKYFNDVAIFDTDTRQWKKVEVSNSGGKASTPCPRSGCVMFPLSDGRGVVVFGGFTKEPQGGKDQGAAGADKGAKKGPKKKEAEDVGRTLSDMFILAPDKHDETMSKWRWYAVKQTGTKPLPKSGMSCAPIPNSNRAFLFGGVQDPDKESTDGADSDSDSEGAGEFFNDIHCLQVDSNEKAVWSHVELSGKRGKDEAKKSRRAAEDEDGSDEPGEDKKDDLKEDMEGMALEDEKSEEPAETTKVVESGAFTISSTVGTSKDKKLPDEASSKKSGNQSSLDIDIGGPSPRFGSAMTVRQGVIYLFGGMVEDEEDRQLTFKDFYSLDTKKLDCWETIVESDIKTMEFYESDDSEDDNSEEESENDEMETD